VAGGSCLLYVSQIVQLQCAYTAPLHMPLIFAYPILLFDSKRFFWRRANFRLVISTWAEKQATLTLQTSTLLIDALG
jgi:hypothetical protein